MRFNDFKIVEANRKQKKADQVRGGEPMPKAKPGRTKHPMQGRLVGEGLNEGARIEHAEDLVFREGSKGAARAIESIKNLESGGHEDVTIKWDGSPAVIFGRNEDGEFVFTDKSGFSAKGYDGKAKSARDLENMLKARPGYAKNPEGYGEFIDNMASIYDEFERATATNFRGFYKGDLLYFNIPDKVEGRYVFTPNVVTYTVSADSEIGKRIGRSETGIVIHRYVDEEGQERGVSQEEIERTMQGNEVLVLPAVTVQEPPEVDDSSIKQLQNILSTNAGAIDKLLDANTLREKKVSDLPQIFYTYLNSKVDTGLNNLAKDFPGWLANSKVSQSKKQKIVEMINENVQGYNAMWSLVEGIMRVKDDIINQLESQSADITATIAGQQGGEGYVLAHPEGDIKLVPREYFSRANRAVER